MQYVLVCIQCRTPISWEGCLLQSTNDTTLPTGPPTLRRAVAALERAGPAAAVALERPSWALEAAWEAFSEEDEACLTAVLRVRNCDCRRTARVAAGILVRLWGEEGAKIIIQARVTQGSHWYEDKGVQWRFSLAQRQRPESADSRLGNFRERGHVPLA